MNKTISINIAGIIFHVNEDAYGVLKIYLEELHKYFSKTEEGKEVYTDIEGRIAEIFSEIITEKNQVITMTDVENVISTLGKVEDLIDTDEEVENEKDTKKENTKTKKRLYRDVDDKTVGGVAKGLSYYFGIDAIIIKIIFILLFIFGGSGLWIYAILWIAIPEAKTTIQKLEMKGEPINLSNLEKNIKEEFENVKENFKNKKYHKDVRSVFEKIFDFFVTIFKGLFKAISSVIGVVFIILAISFLSLIFSSYLFDTTVIQINEFGVDSFSLRDILFFVSDETNIGFIFFSLLIILVIPILSILYFGIKMIFKLHFNSKIISIIFIMFWIFGIVIFTATLIDIGKDFKHAYWAEPISNTTNISDTLYMDIAEITDSIKANDIILSDDDGDAIISLKNIYLEPDINIVETETDSLVRVEIIYSSHGRNKNDCKENINKVNYVWKQKSDTLIMNSHYIINEKFRDQKVRIKIYKPINTEIINCSEENFYDLGT